MDLNLIQIFGSEFLKNPIYFFKKNGFG